MAAGPIAACQPSQAETWRGPWRRSSSRSFSGFNSNTGSSQSAQSRTSNGSAPGGRLSCAGSTTSTSSPGASGLTVRPIRPMLCTFFEPTSTPLSKIGGEAGSPARIRPWMLPPSPTVRSRPNSARKATARGVKGNCNWLKAWTPNPQPNSRPPLCSVPPWTLRFTCVGQADAIAGGAAIGFQGRDAGQRHVLRQEHAASHDAGGRNEQHVQRPGGLNAVRPVSPVFGAAPGEHRQAIEGRRRDQAVVRFQLHQPRVRIRAQDGQLVQVVLPEVTRRQMQFGHVRQQDAPRARGQQQQHLLAVESRRAKRDRAAVSQEYRAGPIPIRRAPLPDDAADKLSSDADGRFVQRLRAALGDRRTHQPVRKELLGRAGHRTAVLQRDARQPIAGEQLDKRRRRIGGNQLAVAQPQQRIIRIEQRPAVQRGNRVRRVPIRQHLAFDLRTVSQLAHEPRRTLGLGGGRGQQQNSRRIRQRVMVSRVPIAVGGIRRPSAIGDRRPVRVPLPCSAPPPARVWISLRCPSRGGVGGFRRPVRRSA